MDEIQRGEIWWADLPELRRSESGYRRPVLVIQADSFNRSRIQTVIVAVITGYLELADAPGNVLVARAIDGPAPRLGCECVATHDPRPQFPDHARRHTAAAPAGRGR